MEPWLAWYKLRERLRQGLVGGPREDPERVLRDMRLELRHLIDEVERS